MEFGFPLYISLIPVAIAAVGLLAGSFLFVKVNKVLGVLIGTFAVLFGLMFGPMLLMDRVLVDEHHIQQNTGIWFDQTEKGFSFDGIQRIAITTGNDLKGRVIEVWIAHYGDRPSVKIDPGDLWELNGDAIVSYISALGIDVVRTSD